MTQTYQPPRGGKPSNAKWPQRMRSRAGCVTALSMLARQRRDPGADCVPAANQTAS
jgi:hypothetical protein